MKSLPGPNGTQRKKKERKKERKFLMLLEERKKERILIIIIIIILYNITSLYLLRLNVNRKKINYKEKLTHSLAEIFLNHTTLINWK